MWPIVRAGPGLRVRCWSLVAPVRAFRHRGLELFLCQRPGAQGRVVVEDHRCFLRRGFASGLCRRVLLRQRVLVHLEVRRLRSVHAHDLPVLSLNAISLDRGDLADQRLRHPGLEPGGRAPSASTPRCRRRVPHSAVLPPAALSVHHVERCEVCIPLHAHVPVRAICLYSQVYALTRLVLVVSVVCPDQQIDTPRQRSSEVCHDLFLFLPVSRVAERPLE